MSRNCFGWLAFYETLGNGRVQQPDKKSGRMSADQGDIRRTSSAVQADIMFPGRLLVWNCKKTRRFKLNSAGTMCRDVI
eukprot:5644681-Heterocapsa_arctica.AAC.1